MIRLHHAKPHCAGVDGHAFTDKRLSQYETVRHIAVRVPIVAGDVQFSTVAGDALNPRLLLLGKEACSLDVLRHTLETALELPFDTFLTSHAPAPLSKAQLEAHLKHLDAFDTARLTETRSAGVRVWLSRFRENGLRSEFAIGEALFDQL